MLGCPRQMRRMRRFLRDVLTLLPPPHGFRVPPLRGSWAVVEGVVGHWLDGIKYLSIATVVMVMVGECTCGSR